MPVTATLVDGLLVEEASGILSGSCSGPWKRHGELPGSMLSEPAPLVYPRPVVFLDFGIGSTWGEWLARVRVQSRDVANAKKTPIS